ncbi:MAG: CoA transferase [Chloroflexi bacterium]|nr:CoA transferase [Chloroflexota bacterium]
MTEPGLPLSEVRVLDLSEGIAGPCCTKLMVHLGADVIKVERPALGDRARSMPPFYQDRPHREGSALFLYLNTGKRGITLDIEDEEGRRLLAQLARSVQVVVESFAPGTMERWGLGYAAMEAANPSLVLASITPFGQTGPYRDLADSDLVLEALSGLLYVAGSPEREPLKIGGNPAYYLAAIHAFTGIMGALLYAEETGVGQHLDIALVECTAMNSLFSHLSYDFTGKVLPRMADITPVFRVRDGYIGLIYRPEVWPRLCRLLGMEELERDPRFADARTRYTNLPELNCIVAEHVRDMEKADLYHRGQRSGVTIGYVCTAPDLLESPQYKERGFFHELDHPYTGPLTYPGIPWKMNDLPLVLGRAPLLGEHNEDVYCGELGVDRAQLKQLQERGTI